VRAVGRRAEATAGLLLASPALVVFIIFMFVPLALTFWYSLHRYSGFGRMTYLGSQNYRDIIQDATFWKALVNTGVYTALSVPIGIALGLGAARSCPRSGCPPSTGRATGRPRSPRSSS
jgi:ABC-type sugar transport system permease subunit